MKEYRDEDFIMPEEKPEAEREAMIADAMIGYGEMPGFLFSALWGGAIIAIIAVCYFFSH